MLVEMFEGDDSPCNPPVPKAFFFPRLLGVWVVRILITDWFRGAQSFRTRASTAAVVQWPFIAT
jgi:hypothetical protein